MPFSNKDLKDLLDSTPIDEIRSMVGSHSDLASVAAYIGENQELRHKA